MTENQPSWTQIATQQRGTHASKARELYGQLDEVRNRLKALEEQHQYHSDMVDHFDGLLRRYQDDQGEENAPEEPKPDEESNQCPEQNDPNTTKSFTDLAPSAAERSSRRAGTRQRVGLSADSAVSVVSQGPSVPPQERP